MSEKSTPSYESSALNKVERHWILSNTLKSIIFIFNEKGIANKVIINSNSINNKSTKLKLLNADVSTISEISY